MESVSGQSASLDVNASVETGSETPRLQDLLHSMKESADVAQPANVAPKWADCPVDSPDSSKEESDAMELLKQMMRADISSTA